MLITLGASLSLVDNRHRNTALHWAIYSRNSNGVSLLLNAGANILTKNVHGDTPLEMAKKFESAWLVKRLEEAQNEKETANKHILIRLYRDKTYRYWLMMASPFVAYYALGMIFECDLMLWMKGLLLIIFVLVSSTFSKYFFDDRMYNLLPMALYLATKFWLFVTFVTYFLPCKCIFKKRRYTSFYICCFSVLSSIPIFGFVATSSLLFYSFYKTWKNDPGVVKQDQDQRFRVSIF